MPNQPQGNGNGNGRNVALPDENRPSWRPQDEHATRRSRRTMAEDDEDDRYLRASWDDREHRDWDRERDEAWRGTERSGQGQSGYGAGRYEGDRSMRFEARNQGYPGSFEDRQRGGDERFAGRGGSAFYQQDRGYHPERYGAPRSMEAERSGPRGYGYSDGDRPNLGTGGAMPSGQASGTWSTGREHAAGHRGAGHRGKGPANYQRSDERIREMVCEALTDDDRIDASQIEVHVKSGEVILTGTIEHRQMKRLAEDVVEQVSGVKDVQNQIRVSGDRKESSESHDGGWRPKA